LSNSLPIVDNRLIGRKWDLKVDIHLVRKHRRGLNPLRTNRNRDKYHPL